jgi:carboxylesterase type B
VLTSVIHQITAFGGSLPVPFQQVIPQSGAFVPRISNEQQEAPFQQFLSMLNISTLQEARSLPSSALVAVNAQQILVAPYGTWPYGPVVDGVFTPDLPGNLLSRGLFARNVKMMIGYNANEGLLFVDPRVTNDTGFRNLLRGDLPLIQDSVLDYILNDLYPPIYDGSQAYTSLTTRIALVIAEAFFTCNSNYFDRAYSNNTFAYQFSIEPAIHGQDIPYTFYNGPSPDVANVTVAQALQDYIVSFAQKGVPTSRLQHAAPFPLYGDDRPTKQDLNLSSISTVVVNKSVNARCLWWQKALYF